MKNIDTLLHARWVIPVDEQQSCLQHHSIAIHDGIIIDILPTESAHECYEAESESSYPNHALMPGLINAHTHAAMNLFRGLADDLPLMDWLQNHIWPAETRWVNEDFVHSGTESAIAEMIRGGTTCFNDMYFFPDVTARIAKKAGIRACVGLIVLDFPTVWANDPEEYIDKGLSLRDVYREDELIKAAFAPHAPYTVSDAPLQKLKMFSDELEIPVHMHIHETAQEIAESEEKFSMRPMRRLTELGLISPTLVAVHMTQLEENEITQLAEAGSHVVHCPQSNLKLASGFCPVKKLMDKGVNVALGTDSSASNNNLDMFAEMQTAALLAKGVANDATALTAHQALEMATLNGARAIGLDEKTGSLEKDKSADIIAVDFDMIETQPVYDPVSHLVYACSRDQVTDVWVAGKHLMNNRVLTTMDIDQIKTDSSNWQKKIAETQHQD